MRTWPLRQTSLPVTWHAGTSRPAAFSLGVHDTLAPAGPRPLVQDQQNTGYRVPEPGEEPVAGRSTR